MSHTETLRIRIDDLPLVELLTPEEEAVLFGAGPRKPALGVELLEDRQLLTGGLSASLLSNPRGQPGASSLGQDASRWSDKTPAVLSRIAGRRCRAIDRPS